MRFSRLISILAASAGLVAAQTDPAGQCIQTCFAKVGQDNPDSPDIKRCQALADGLQQLLCLCRSAPLVDAFTTCAGETCPEFAAQVNGTAICQSSETGALDPTGSGDAGPSDSASSAGAGPSSTVSGAGTVPGTNTASGAGATNTAGESGPSNTVSGAGAANTGSGAPAAAPTNGGTDAGNGAGAQRVEMINCAAGGVAVLLASGLLV